MRLRAPLTIGATAAVIAAAALVWHALPVNTQTYAPFDVHAKIGAPAKGRGVTATITAVDIAPRVVVQPYGRPLTAAGVWVVVATTLDAGDRYDLPQADLLVGPNTYVPTDRIVPTGTYLQPGITEDRTWVFDVAAEPLGSVSSAVLRVWVGDGRLDSRLVIDIPLDDANVRRVKSVDVPPTVEEAR